MFHRDHDPLGAADLSRCHVATLHFKEVVYERMRSEHRRLRGVPRAERNGFRGRARSSVHRVNAGRDEQVADGDPRRLRRLTDSRQRAGSQLGAKGGARDGSNGRRTSDHVDRDRAGRETREIARATALWYG